jgi:hypothetical protein
VSLPAFETFQRTDSCFVIANVFRVSSPACFMSPSKSSVRRAVSLLTSAVAQRSVLLTPANRGREQCDGAANGERRGK